MWLQPGTLLLFAPAVECYPQEWHHAFCLQEEVAELWAKAEIPDDDEELAAELKKIGESVVVIKQACVKLAAKFKRSVRAERAIVVGDLGYGAFICALGARAGVNSQPATQAVRHCALRACWPLVNLPLPPPAPPPARPGCAGVKPAPRKAPRQRGAREKKKKQRKQTRIRNVTNVHMMHLFEGDAPVAIDQD